MVCKIFTVPTEHAGSKLKMESCHFHVSGSIPKCSTLIITTKLNGTENLTKYAAVCILAGLLTKKIKIGHIKSTAVGTLPL
jgi:hypothetical protein